MALGQKTPTAAGPTPGPTAPPRPDGWTTRFGEACLLGLGVASLGAVPTALRTAGAGGSFLEGLLVGAAVLLPLVTLSLVLARAAGRGFRGIVGRSPARVAVLQIALWIGVAVPVLAALAALLKALTHHRGLAGATFGVLGLAGVAAAALIAHRMVTIGERLAARRVKPWILAAIGAAVGVLPLLAVASPLARSGGDVGAAAIRAAIIDGVIALVATALVSSIDLGAAVGRIASLAGVPAAAIVLIAATARLESSPALGQAVRAGGGLAATLLGALERWTDRDRDGMGAHFGGVDCDEGDPAVRPGAAELPGDGIDQDCDGVDPPRPDAPVASAASTGDVVPAGAKTLARAGAPAAASPAAASPAAATPAAGHARPDVILITLDTVRADHTSAYGYGRDTSPRLAELAARGVLFERAYATASDTQRAIAPLVVGRRLNRAARDTREWPTLLPENDTIAERMKRAGYLTAAVSSFTWISQERGFDQGFDRFEAVFGEAHPEREVSGPLAISKALAILEELVQRAQPIFLWVHLFDAHERYLDHPGIHFGKGRTAAYDGEIAFVDRQMGALLDAVARGPRAGRTAFIVHGSQGEGLGEHDAVGHGAELYEEVLRVPMVISLPQGGRGGRYAHPVSTIDLAPTVLALGGAPAEGVEGEPLVAIASGDLAAAHGPVFARGARRVAIIDGPLKLLVVERKRRDRILLFDLAADPGELRDLSDARPDELQRMLEKRGAFELPEK